MSKNPLYIRIPKKIDPRLKDRWAAIRACNGSRTKMVNWLTDNGGYRDRHEEFAIEFDVSTWRADLDVEHLWKRLCEMGEFGILKMPPEKQVVAKHLFESVYAEHENNVWRWGCEEAYEGWRDSDTPYETFVGERVSWNHELRGRGGKHLVMTECEGLNLRCDSDELAERLMERSFDGARWEWDISSDTVRKLFIVCVQNYFELTPSAVADEVEYRAAWRLWASFCEDQLEERFTVYKNRERLTESAQHIHDNLIGSDASNAQAREDFCDILALSGIIIQTN